MNPSEQNQTSPPPSPGVPGEGVIVHCPACGCRDLFVRKDFPQKLGLLIVLLAGVSFLILAARRSSFYIGVMILIVAAIIDALLFAFVGKVTVCYKCRAEFRDRPINPEHGGFDLATSEKYRGAPPPALHG